MLSIVVFCKNNTSAELHRTFDSLRAQNLKDCQILVADQNEWNDDYSRSLQEDLENYPEFELLPFLEKKTAGACRNRILEYLRGKYTAFLEASEKWKHDKAKIQVEFLESDPGCWVNVCNGVILQETGKKRILRETTLEPEKWLVTEPPICASQFVYRTQVLRQTGGFDSRLDAFVDLDRLLQLPDMMPDVRIQYTEKLLFTCQEKPALDQAKREYEAARILLYKNYDLLLRNRRMAYHYYFRLARLAARNTLWVQMLINILLAIRKRPLYSLKIFLFQILGSIGKLIVFWLKGIHLGRQARLCRKQVSAAAKGRKVVSAPRLPGLEKQQEVVIPEGQRVIRRGQFSGSSLVRVEIPASVDRIEAHAFAGCRNLQEVVFHPGSTLHFIGAYAFAGCTGLSKLVLPGTLSQLEKYAFAGCRMLSDLQFLYYEEGRHTIQPLFPMMLSKFSKGVFAGCRELRSVELMEGSLLSDIEAYAFCGCTGLKQVQMNGKIVRIGEYAFARCSQLENLVFPGVDAIHTIGKYAFLECSSLSHFQIPYALNTIQAYTFYGCASLKYIKIPKNVLFIDHHAFGRCEALELALISRASTKYVSSAFESYTSIQVGGKET